MRWDIEVIYPPGVDAFDFANSKAITPVPELMALCNPTTELEDMPWPLEAEFIISERFRQFLQEQEPGAVQYVPIRMLWKSNRKPIGAAYWLANWLRVCDCLDRRWFDPNDVSLPDGGPIRPRVIEPSRVSGRICRVKYFEVITLVRRDLRDEIRRRGFTGPQFYEMWHSTDHVEGLIPPFKT